MQPENLFDACMTHCAHPHQFCKIKSNDEKQDAECLMAVTYNFSFLPNVFVLLLLFCVGSRLLLNPSIHVYVTLLLSCSSNFAFIRKANKELRTDSG